MDAFKWRTENAEASANVFDEKLKEV